MSTAHRRFVFWIGASLLVVFLAGVLYFSLTKPLSSIGEDFASYRLIGERVQKDFNTHSLIPVQEDYTINDTLKDGIDIQFANQQETLVEEVGVDAESEEVPLDTNSLSLAFPEDLDEPLAITLPGGKVITVVHNVDESYSRSLLTNNSETDAPTQETIPWPSGPERSLGEVTSAERSFLPSDQIETPASYIKYTSSDDRINTYYAYQKDQAAGYRNLKHWTIFEKGDGHEERSYTFTNAHLSLNDNGEAEVRYLPDNYQSNQEIQNEVGQDLWARAQATLGAELNQDILNQPVDFIIPAPYFIDSLGEMNTLEWKVNETNDTISLIIETDTFSYPIALDPTLQFTAPGVSNAGGVIDGEEGTFGRSLTTADLNNDGKEDLVVGADSYNGETGRVYVFYNGNSDATQVDSADLIIDGESSVDYFGSSLNTGDFDNDGTTDLVVGAHIYSVNTGRAYIFYNDGSIPTTAATADVIIAGEGTNNYFGISLTTGDLDADGDDDLVVGAYGRSSYTGRAYIFYNDGSIPTTAATADVIISGEASNNYFGWSLTTGDLDADGDDDLVVGASGYSTNTGRAYIFYNDGSIPTTAATADVIITGEISNSYFGGSLTTGDLNNNGQTDLAVGAYIYSANTGRAYIFYNDGSIPTTAATADVIISGEGAFNYFGESLTTGDFDNDGKDDLVVGAYGHNTNTGRAYIFYNDGSIPTTAATADVTITGESANNRFGSSFTAGDLNNDGIDDLVVGANEYNTSTGRTYIFYSQSGQVNLNTHVTGEGTGDYFGSAFAVGDLNGDGRDDLAVGAYKDATNTGKVYIFYGDGEMPTGAGSADVIITGEGAINYFGESLTTADLNNDGKDDLVVGARGHNSSTGRAYIFYNDGSIPTTAVTADVIISGESFNNQFGYTLTTADLNNDGTEDLVVGASEYSSDTGRAYIFYNDGSIPTTAATADVTITGEGGNNYFGESLTTGDFDNDGTEDLVVGAYGHSFLTGRAYIFYNDGSIPTTAATADVIISGETTTNRFGISLTAGDLNADGKDDLVVGAHRHNSSTGRAYIFYNDGSIPTTAATADVTITGEGTSNYFGSSLTTGDLNNDGTEDLVVGAYRYDNNYTGRAYVYYSGTFSTSSMEAATSSSLMITGDSTNDDFGYALATGDFNNDGKDDLVIGAPGYDNGGDTGRIYFNETREDYAWEIQRSDTSDGLRIHPIMGHELKITGETSSGFGNTHLMADLNNDGKDDLVVGASGYNSNQGKVYIFYNDGNYPTRGGGADVVIVGEATNNYFGSSLTTGDLNNDGTEDLAVGARGHNSSTGKVYIFYNDGSIPTTASSADVGIVGEASFNNFGFSLTVGDLDADGDDDLAVGAYFHNISVGRAYIFHNDGSIPTTAATSDVTITGEGNGNSFSVTLVTGDFNNDGTEDLVVGASGHNLFTGRAYIFYNDGSIPTTAATADVIITGESTSNYFGSSLTTGDLNNDGKEDLVVGANGHNTSTGRAYIFYNDGSIPTTAATADVIITGETANNGFGISLTTADLNADGDDDLVVGASGYSTNTGRAYIFYNDGSIPTTAATADVIISGEGASNYFGSSFSSGDINNDGTDDLLVGADSYNSGQGRLYMYTTNDRVITGEGTDENLGSSFATGDFNDDGKTDLVVGASGYSSGTGRAYIFYGGKKATSSVTGADVIITGEASSAFGSSLTTGDLNSDGTEDLVVGASEYSSDTGRAYIFYNDGSIPTTAATADVIISGETANNGFGISLTTADLNADGKADLAVGADEYNSFTGRAYIFYNDGSIPTTAATADVIITGEGIFNGFGISLTTADLDADGTDDLVVGANKYIVSTGRAYIFYNDGSIPTTAGSADVIISGETPISVFGSSLTTGDLNADGKDDLVVGAYGHNTSTGRVYIFYNDGSIPTTAATADVIISGETANSRFGISLTTTDLNADGKDDLVVGARGHDSNTGRVYIFYNDSLRTEGAEDADVIITGEETSSNFGISLIADDLSGNGIDDLVIGANTYDDPDDQGRIHILMSEASAEHVSEYKLRGNLKFKGTVKFH